MNGKELPAQLECLLLLTHVVCVVYDFPGPGQHEIHRYDFEIAFTPGIHNRWRGDGRGHDLYGGTDLVFTSRDRDYVDFQYGDTWDIRFQTSFGGVPFFGVQVTHPLPSIQFALYNLGFHMLTLFEPGSQVICYVEQLKGPP